METILKTLKLSPSILGALLLLTAAVAAVVWSNSPWGASYVAMTQTMVGISIGPWSLEKTALHWINDGLMGIFFFHVGLEVKREVLAGKLRRLREAALPVAAAIGGMVVPALVYLAFTFGTPAQEGWAIPMATDIAFALGVLALMGNRVPLALKVFLTALAIVDDIGAVLVIALVHTADLSLLSLGLGLLLFGVAMVMNRSEVRSPLAYLLVGTLVWLFFLKSGVHATVAALIMAFAIPSFGKKESELKLKTFEQESKNLSRAMSEDGSLLQQQSRLDRAVAALREADSPLVRLEHDLLPLVAFVVLPIFALANAGVVIEGFAFASLGSITWGVALGLFVGKQIGVLLFSWVAVKLGWATLPEGVTFRMIHAVALLSGIGFTMALFISGLAFTDAGPFTEAKLGVLLGSATSGAAGWLLLRLSLRRRSQSNEHLAAIQQSTASPLHAPNR